MAMAVNLPGIDFARITGPTLIREDLEEGLRLVISPHGTPIDRYYVLWLERRSHDAMRVARWNRIQEWRIGTVQRKKSGGESWMDPKGTGPSRIALMMLLGYPELLLTEPEE